MSSSMGINSIKKSSLLRKVDFDICNLIRAADLMLQVSSSRSLIN